MFTMDLNKNLHPLNIYLSNPQGDLLYCLNDAIDENTASLSPHLINQYSLSFTINQYITDSQSGELIKTPGYDKLLEGMYLVVENVGLFKMQQPTINITSDTETKDITANSCDIELEDKTCSISVNMGTSTSMEYLVTYDDDETEQLVNPYTNIPYDWIVVYNMFPEQLSIFKEKIQNNEFGTMDANGNIVIANSTLINEVDEFCTLIPRLKNKLTEIAVGDAVDYELTEYVIYEYNEENSLLSITFTNEIIERIDYLISFYTKYRDQLSLIPLVLEKTDGNWTVGEIYGLSDNNFSLANKKYQFEIDESIYAFLSSTFSKTSECLINYDIKHRKVNIKPFEFVGNDTGVILSYENLLNNVNISCNENTLNTRFNVYGANGLSIEQVNFGLSYIDDITYKLNIRDENGDRIYVSDELAEKYLNYIDFREEKRIEYIDLSKKYNYYLGQIDEIKYRVPADSLKTDWGTFRATELAESLKTYKNLLASLIALYKEDYGDVGLNDDGSVNETYIKTTEYWYDYIAYKNTINEIDVAMVTYPNYSDEKKWDSTKVDEYKELISAWETEWTLYGSVELHNKIIAYNNQLDALAEKSVVIKNEETREAATWSELSDVERSSYGNNEGSYTTYYNEYVKIWNNRNSAQIYLDTLLKEIDSLEKEQNEYAEKRIQIVDEISLSSYFTSEECKVINLLYKDAEYTNENILTTSLDDVVSTVDIQLELLNDAKVKASIYSRPQLIYSSGIDNLFGLLEYKPLWSDFNVGNYVLVQYKDDTYSKLRLLGYTFNPLLPTATNFDVTFSNFVRSNIGITDIESVLGVSIGGTVSSYSGSSSSGSSGDFGESDDIDVTISNTMLSKLLNSELFGTRVTNVILDTIDANAITAKYAEFGGLANGTTMIDGNCITTGVIKSGNYVEGTSGSMLNLHDGTFDYAGGALTFKQDADGNYKLINRGALESDEGHIGGWEIGKTELFSSGYNSKLELDYKIALSSSTDFNNKEAKAIYISATDADNETFYPFYVTPGGYVWMQEGNIGPWTFGTTKFWRGSEAFGAAGNGNIYLGNDGLSISDKFIVGSNGYLTLNTTTDLGTYTLTSSSSGFEIKSSIEGTTSTILAQRQWGGSSNIALYSDYIHCKQIGQSAGSYFNLDAGTLSANGNGSFYGNLYVSGTGVIKQLNDGGHQISMGWNGSGLDLRVDQTDMEVALKNKHNMKEHTTTWTSYGNLSMDTEEHNLASVSWVKTKTDSSDERVKTNFKELPKCIDEIYDCLKPRQYKFNNILGKDGIYFGDTAQHIESVFEENGLDPKEYAIVREREVLEFNGESKYIDKDNDTYHYINQDNITWITVDQVQKLKKQITSLKSENESLKTELNNIKQILERAGLM